MAVVKKIAGLVAIAALSYFTFGAGGLVASGALGSGFLGFAIGTAIVAAGTFVIQALLVGGGQRSPSIEAGKVNVRIADPPRWLHCGRARSGGGALFGEFDADGRFWYIIVHSDEILHPGYSYFLDDVPVTLGPDRYVQQPEFRLKTNKDKDPAETLGEGKGYVRIWTTTYSETDPVPPGIAELTAALPQWTADEHLVAGSTYSVICMDGLKVEHRYKIYRWRGPFGLGEPAVSVVGDWANAYDPRDPTQVLGNRATYKPTRNTALVLAWFRTHPFGRGKPESSVAWDLVAEQADICDQIVTGIDGDQKRYEAGVSVVDSKRRADAEKEMLLACDGQIVFDEQGKWWVRVGHWYTPTLSFSRNRDIMAMSSVEAQDGESETQGVIVRYIEPTANFTVQPAAAWINPLYYDPLTTPKFLTIDIQACQNHNQAMRLAKGIGMRSQPRHKLGPTVNLRGLQARQERIVTINYDNTFAGDYEIATPVELSGDGIMTGFGAVPIEPNRWTLLPGEEQPRPVIDGGETVVSYPAITGETVTTADGAIRIDFPPVPRSDATYTAEYILTDDITGAETDPWLPMAVNLTTAMSGRLLGSSDYTVRYRYVTASGRGPAWEYDTVTTQPDQLLDPASEVQASVTGYRQVTLTWRAPRSPLFDTVAVVADGVEGPKLPKAAQGAPMSVVRSSVPLGAHSYVIRAFPTDGSAPVDSAAAGVTIAAAAFTITGTALPAGMTLARASIGTRTGNAGTLVQNGVDAPRFDFSPVSPYPLRGLLVEAAATNRLLYSQDLTGAAWTPTAVVANATALIETTANSIHRVAQTVAFISGEAATISSYASERGGSAKRHLVKYLPASVAGTVIRATYDLAAGTATISGPGTATMEPAPGGWQCALTVVPTATVSAVLELRLATTANSAGAAYTGDGASGVNLGEAQVQTGTRADSRVRTTTAAVTRAADVVTLAWGSKGVPDGPLNTVVTFDDGSTQAVAMTVAGGSAVLTTTLNRSRVKAITETN